MVKSVVLTIDFLMQTDYNRLLENQVILPLYR
jgi:hypothetical protein